MIGKYPVIYMLFGFVGALGVQTHMATQALQVGKYQDALAQM